MKKSISILLCVLMMMTFVRVYADNTLYIGSAEELKNFADRVNAGETFENLQVVLTDNILLNYKLVSPEGELLNENATQWTSIGKEKSPFKGVFNGNGHTITGIYIQSEENFQGLFGYVCDAQIYNVTVKDSYISASAHAGAIVGAAFDNSVIKSCHNDNSSIFTKDRSGGIVGWTDKSHVYDSSSNGYCYSNRCSGGIVGDVYSSGKIYNCYNGGEVDGKSLVGGITGGSTSADLQSCINVGEIVKGGYLISGGAGTRSLKYCFAVSNETLNAGISIGSGSSTTRIFKTPEAILEEPVDGCSTVLEALNLWVKANTGDIVYSPWKQTNMYPFLRDGVSSSIKTSFGSETSEWSNPDLEEAFEKDLIPEILVTEDLTRPISRAEFAALAVQLYRNLTGEDPKADNPIFFKDIAGNPAENDIKIASSLGIAQGMGNAIYEPNTKINREQLATMLCRTIKKYAYVGWTCETDSNYYMDTSGVAVFSDDSDISDWAKPSVYYMAKFGIISGIDASHFAPKNTTDEQTAQGYADATREQAIIMALRIARIADVF